MDIQLKTYVFLDSLQPQLASFLGTTASGFLPVPGQASLFMEVAPGIVINLIQDVALKATKVKPSTMVVERAFGSLEIHHDEQGEVRQAGTAVLKFLEKKESHRQKPKIVSNQVIRSIEPAHAVIVNRIRKASMILPGESLFILETDPAGYALLAANEAEKAARVTLVHVQPFGAFGRLWLSGPESEIDSAQAAAIEALKNLDGI